MSALSTSSDPRRPVAAANRPGGSFQRTGARPVVAAPAALVAPVVLAVLGALAGAVWPASAQGPGSASPDAAGSAAAHPLDPLSADEIRSATRILRESGRLYGSFRIHDVYLREPPKPDDWRFEAGAAGRRAFVSARDLESRTLYEGVVDLAAGAVESWRAVPGANPYLTGEEFARMREIVRAHPGWRAAMRRRGVEDFDGVYLSPWPGLAYDDDELSGGRFVRVLSFLRGESRNRYARPVEGVAVRVDLDREEVLEVVDTGDPLPVPPAEPGDAVEGIELRDPAPPLLYAQPEGAGFEIRGHEIRWEGWRFRYGLHPREGVVIRTATREDGGRRRPVLYRGSLSALFVPYGAPGPMWHFRAPFDLGNFGGFGYGAGSLDRGTDCPNHARFLDATVPGAGGEPRTVPRAVCVYERDAGILWKHVFSGGENESRRARELVVAFVALVGNYEYGFNWVFGQDGAVAMEVEMTGIVMTRGVRRERDSERIASDGRYGTLVDANREAVNHQHWFNFRLDLDVDGARNTAVELSTSGVPTGPDNPYGTAMRTEERILRTEKEARRHIDLPRQRRWLLANPRVRNDLGQPTAYLLFPGENSLPYPRPGSLHRRRAGFMDAHVWVTPRAPEERYAAGDYPTGRRTADGLAAWTEADRPIEDTDVVLWYSMGITHVPRPEDWPVMPVHPAGFRLLPWGFYDENPALDVPEPTRLEVSRR